MNLGEEALVQVRECKNVISVITAPIVLAQLIDFLLGDPM
jgi:hypothetical protein